MKISQVRALLPLIKVQASSWLTTYLIHFSIPDLKNGHIKNHHIARKEFWSSCGICCISKKKLLKNKQNKILMMRRQREASLKIKELFSTRNAVLIIHKNYSPPNVFTGI